MSQVPGSNAAGEVFADFKLNTAPAEQGIDRIGQKAVDTANKLESEVGAKGGASVKQITSNALGAAAAVGAVIASVDRVLKAVGEWNAAAADLARVYREIDVAAGQIADSAGAAGANFDQLAKQATEFGQAQIESLARATEAWDIATLARKAYANVMDVDLEEEAQIEQILNRRKQLLEVIARLRKEAAADAAIEAERKAGEDLAKREANAIKDLAEAADKIRRDALTEQERKIEDIEARLKAIKDLSESTGDPMNKAALAMYATIFADELKKAMDPVANGVAKTMAEAFANQVRDQFGGIFDQGGLREYGVSLQSQLTAIESQLRSVGSLGGG